MPRMKYTEEDRDRALKLYRAGMNGTQIEGVTGIHRATVHKWARQEGVVRPRSTVQLSRKEKLEVKRLYNRNRHSCSNIARITGIPVYQVYYYLRKQGLTRNPAEARRVREQKRQFRINA